MAQINNATVAARFAKIRVLIVDDDPGMRELVKTLLTAMGVRAIWEAKDGLDGLGMVQRIAPDVIILDWEMPRIRGPNFMRILRSPDTFRYPATPVIMLTSHAEPAKVKEAIAVGVNEYLLKAVSSKGLLDRMISVLFHPRPMTRTHHYYGPVPRKTSEAVRDSEQENQDLVLV